MINTIGTNLLDIFANPSVDSEKTICNNIIDTYDILGIEAARYLLIEELYSTLVEVAPLDKRHILILVDRMTQNGYLTKANSNGMDHFNNGPLAKASFEKVLYHLRNASINSLEDNIKGMSSNIMLGQVPPCGTGTVKVSFDDDFFRL